MLRRPAAQASVDSNVFLTLKNHCQSSLLEKDLLTTDKPEDVSSAEPEKDGADVFSEPEEQGATFGRELENGVDSFWIGCIKHILWVFWALISSLYSRRKPYTWINWNKNQSTNAKVVRPFTLAEMQQAVRDASHVRVAAFGHSWAPIVCTHEDVDTTLISTHSLKQILSTKEDVLRTNSITIECGVSIQQLEDWLRTQGIPLTVAMNVVLTDVYMTGVTASLCHGAGYEWSSIADFVCGVTLIDANGELTTYTALPKEQIPIPKTSLLQKTIKQVSAEMMTIHQGALGLLGAIYALTVELIPDDVIVMTDKLLPVEEVEDPSKLKKLVEEYNGWVEVFWVPTAPYVWVKSWKRALKGTAAVPPNHSRQDYFNSFMANIIWRLRQLALGLGVTGVTGKPFITTMLIGSQQAGLTVEGKQVPLRRFDAIHYQDYLSNMRLEDTEFALPVDEDYERPAAAFNKIRELLNAHAKNNHFPVDLSTEFRFTGGSNVNLAHYPASRSKKWVHMEFLSYTTADVPVLEKKWDKFIQEIAPHWQALGGMPHWAKGWHKISGIENYIAKNVVTDEFREYRQNADPTGKFMPARLAPIFQ